MMRRVRNIKKSIAVLGLYAGVFSACGEPPMQVDIPFVATYAGMPLTCESSAPVSMTDLRFYVYDLHLTAADDSEHSLSLGPDGAFQQSGLAFVDLENGAGDCQNGTEVTHGTIAGTVAAGDYRGLSFTLGVPFDRNHADPLTARAPLGDPDMHWHWRGGYKFLRAGFRTEDDGFWLHLGSTGCEGTIRNIAGCSAPNRVAVELPEFVPGRDVVRIDLAELVATGELDDAEGTDCSSGPAEEHCATAFAALGLDHATGQRQGSQRLFVSGASK
jgi:uncharacterized repeat protein (TIGR04052 family)